LQGGVELEKMSIDYGLAGQISPKEHGFLAAMNA
jgi:hypothetical protein